MPDARHANPGRRYETRDVSARSMAYSAIGLAVLVVVGFASSWIVMKYFVRVQPLGPPASPFDKTRELPPAPRLQVSPVEDLKEYQAREETQLQSYGWVDREAGIVRIPIERAKELSLERGFPVRAGQASGTAQTSAAVGNAPRTDRSSQSEINSSE